jgi:hypothetical protein
MTSRRNFLIGLGGALLPLPARAQTPVGVVHELSGEVYLNDYRMARNSAVQPGHSVSTGPLIGV